MELRARSDTQPMEKLGMKRKTLAVVIAAFILPVAGAIPSADAARAKHYRNCKALNKTYAHGVGRKGARDHTTGKRVKNFTRNNRVYRYNAGLDRDDDGIACERR